MSESLSCCLAVVLVLLLPIGVFAIDLPLVMKWNSANTFTYAPDQPVKELAWSEFYQLDASIDSLRKGNVSMGLNLHSRANFINTQVEIEHANITYHASKYNIGARISPSGYALENQYHPARMINRSNDVPLFLASRFNGVFFHLPSRIDLKLEAGGNFYNLACGKLTEGFSLFNKNASLSLIQEVQTFDAYGHKPVVIGATEFEYNHGNTIITATGAAAMYPEYDSVAAYISPFIHAEVSHRWNECYTLYLQGTYKELSTENSIWRGFDAAIARHLSKFTISTGTRYDIIDKGEQISPYAILKWIPADNQHLGVYIRSIFSDTGNDLYQFGMQAELSFGL